MLTVLTPPAATALTTVPALRRELKLTTEEFDPALKDLIGDATAAINAYLDRDCARRKVRETLEGSGDVILLLAAPPIVYVAKVTYRGEVIVDYEIDDARVGTLYREAGWQDCAFRSGFLGVDSAPGRGARDWGLEYFSGWLLPDNDYTAGSISFAAADSSINDLGLGLPPVVNGDLLTIENSVLNNQQVAVVSATPSKIIVSGTIADEAAPSDDRQVTLHVRNLPRDIERACLTTAAAWYQARGRDPEVSSKRVADTAVTYRDPSPDGGSALPPRALELLRPWVRT